MSKTCFSCGFLVIAFCAAGGAAEPGTVHEWGTFTSLQDETGAAVGGINTDDEPVPGFVHRLGVFPLVSPTELPPVFFKGAPACHPDVTMRLETPVLYFHRRPGASATDSATVRVRFRGGWLTEFYPTAGAEADGATSVDLRFRRLGPGSESQLTWDGLEVGGEWAATNTSARVWTAPRAVDAAMVRTRDGESERFLFYRGVGHINAPLRISREGGQLVLRSQISDLPADKPLSIEALWLVDIRPGGELAFRALPPVTLRADSNTVLAQTAATFAPGDFKAGNLDRLKHSLQRALVANGLFADEARALLNTWEASYFKSAGLRAFFLVPRPWTDFYLPLEISPSIPVNRVMVGRIELVTPEQRQALTEIARLSGSEIRAESQRFGAEYLRAWSQRAQTGNHDAQRVEAGQKPISSLVAVPKSYQVYLSLGRFRNALLLDAAKGNPSKGLTSFIAAYGLQGYQPRPPALSSHPAESLFRFPLPGVIGLIAFDEVLDPHGVGLDVSVAGQRVRAAR